MSRLTPLYAVTGKKITAMLIEERDRKQKHMASIKRKLKRLNKDIKDVYWSYSCWEGATYVHSLELKKDADKTMWKKSTAGFVPRRSTKIQREFSKKYEEICVRETFFHTKEIKEAMNYLPKEDITNDTKNNIVFSNVLKPGWSKDKFFFNGYEGFKPARGIKEITISKYNKAFEGK